MSALAPVVTGAETRRSPSSIATFEPLTVSTIRAVADTCACSTTISNRSPPTCRLSSSDEPRAITRP